MQELLLAVARGLVDEPDAVQVTVDWAGSLASRAVSQKPSAS